MNGWGDVPGRISPNSIPSCSHRINEIEFLLEISIHEYSWSNSIYFEE